MRWKYSFYVLICFLPGCRSIQSVDPFSGMIMIDGKLEEGERLKGYDVDTQLLYNVSIDENSIYFQLGITSASQQQSVIKNGLGFWINLDGKKKKVRGIRYPVRERQAKRSRKSSSQKEKFSIQSELEKNNATLEFTGFFGAEEMVADLGQLKVDLRLAMGFDEKSKSLIYELKVPYDLIYQVTSPSKDDEIIAGFEITTTTVRVQGQRAAQGRSGGGRVGGGGRGGGGGSGGSRPQSSANSVESTSSQVLWLKVQI